MKMLKKRSNVYGRMSEVSATTTSSTTKEENVEWEMRPGGMLVQKRSEQSDNLAPNLLVRIAYGAVRYEISVKPQATFGELKKLLTAETGLQPEEQSLLFRGKERENGEYLDICGVKNRSKVILVEDPSSKEKRFVEMRKNAKIQSIQSAISNASMEIDKLAEQVIEMEKSITKGSKVPEVQITTMIEMLMRQAIRLDSISTEGTDAASQKILQGKRVQKSVETLDALKILNAKVKPVVVTTKWETFDPAPTAANWEFFD